MHWRGPWSMRRSNRTPLGRLHEMSPPNATRQLQAIPPDSSERSGKYLDVPLGAMHADHLPVRDQSRGLLDTYDSR